MRRERPDHAHVAKCFDLPHLLQVFLAQVEERARARAAGVVDENVHRAEPCDCLLGHALHLRTQCEVGRDGVHRRRRTAAPVAGNRARSPRQCLVMARDQHEGDALAV